jgi:hydrogenase maturation protease
VYHDRTLILGFGSDALSDDGLPVRMVEDLKDLLDSGDFDFGTSPVGGLELIELLKDRRKAILIDTQLTGRRMHGKISIFTPERFEETLHLSSQHDLSFHNVLRLAREMDIPFPEEILIIAVEVVENKRLGFEFSEVIEGKYRGILAEVFSVILSG